MTFAETSDVYSNTKNNNNIAWKNISILDNLPNLRMISSSVLVKYSDLCKNGNCINKIVFNIPYVNPKHKEVTNILKYTKINLKLNEQLLKAYKMSKSKIKGAKIDEKGNIRITANRVEIPVLLEKEIDNYSFKVTINKPKKLPKYLKELKFDVMQMIDEKTIIGGERFILPINKYRPIKRKDKE